MIPKTALELSINPTSVFEDVARIVSSITGVQLGERQKTMVETRVRRRIMDLGVTDEHGYSEYLRTHLEAETGMLVSLLTTHHTYFFREFAHFEFLEKKAISACVAAAQAQGRKTLRVWSAACSRGQEVYSLAMYLAFHLPRLAPGFSFEIVGADVDPESVAIARNGVYHRSEIKEVPLSFLGDHWARGTGDISEFVKAKKALRNSCRFEVGNLIQLGAPKAGEEYDIIFCRNVFIYFTPEQIKQITSRLIERLSPYGYLFVGISETLNGLNLPITYEGPSIYSRTRPKTAATGAARPAAPAPVVSITAAPSNNALIRVLCVDDSPSVHTLLKRILCKENGFEIVAIAMNGLEAAAKLKQHKVDVVTLDIHMPEQTGTEYLQKNYGPGHPPVVMITSVSRENSDLAMLALKSGASDFVEKPALANFAERGEEIRTKLLCAVQSRANTSAKNISLDQAFKTKPVITAPDKCLRAIVAGYSHVDKLAAFFREATGKQPPSIIFVEGAREVLGEYTKALSSKIGLSVELIDSTQTQLRAGSVYLADFGSSFEPIMHRECARSLSVLVYGATSAHSSKLIQRFSGSGRQLLVEDPGSSSRPEENRLSSVASDVVPATSFPYMSMEFLSKTHG
ncbi:CheR family methyltransferase [Bdellovibrionota bacterium FG-1]